MNLRFHTAPRERSSGDPLVISEVRRGSIAHRSGTLQPGDKLLAIDQFRMESSTIEEAARILQNCQGVVQLRIRKDEHCSGKPWKDYICVSDFLLKY